MIALNKYIVISKINEEVKSSSGLIMDAEDKREVRYSRGVVVTPGTEVRGLSKGDEIYYDRSAGHNVRLGSELYTIIRESDVVVCFPGSSEQ